MSETSPEQSLGDASADSETPTTAPLRVDVPEYEYFEKGADSSDIEFK